MVLRRTLFLFFLTLNCAVWGQEISTLIFKVDKLTIKEKVQTKNQVFSKYKTEAETQFRLNGFIGLEMRDSTTEKSTRTYTYSYKKRIKQIVLSDSANSKFTISNNFNLAVEELNLRIKKLENHGYPFAQLKINSEQIIENRLHLDYSIDSGDYFIIEEIVIKSKETVKEKTVLNLINIQPGDFYNEQKISKIEHHLRNSGFYKLVQPTQILFTPGKATIYLFLEGIKSSSADGYVGLQQNQNTGRLSLNGYVNLSLNNAFKRATKIDLNWRNNPDKTQLFTSRFDFPFLFNTPLGVGAHIDLQKQDTSFIRSDLQFYLGYRNPTFSAKIFTSIQQSSLLGEPIPNFRTFSKTAVGGGFTISPVLTDKLEFFRPKLAFEGGFFTYREDTIQDLIESPLNFSLTTKYSHEIRFLRFFSLNNSLSFQDIYSPTALARNELSFFGGLRTLRGFYELELTGNEVWILANEIVFKPVKAFELKLIYDYSRFEYLGANYSHSAGVGFGLNAGNSLLEIVIANGTLNDNPFLLTNTKVHIGFKSNF